MVASPLPALSHSAKAEIRVCRRLAEVSGLRWVGETPPAIAIAECEKAEGARAEGGERKRKREGCGL